jgi:hypothetical protein
MLEPDGAAISAFVRAIFPYADPATYVSLRAFDQVDRGVPPLHIEAVLVGDDPDDLVQRAVNAARRAANAARPAVFAPPVCTFSSARTARSADVANGVALSVEIDSGDPAPARAQLESLLGPATIVIASGGEWQNPETGELHPKLHMHWRLAEPTATAEEHAKLQEARWMAASLAGGDPTAAPPAHPLRWPGSWNRKRAPRLATILALNDAAEIELSDAAEKLAEALEATGLGRKAGAAPKASGTPQAPVADVAAALLAIPNAEAHWDDWNRMGMATWRATGGSAEGLAAWEAWSAKSSKHDGNACADRWRHFGTSPPNLIGAGTIFMLARRHGWSRPKVKGRAALRVVEGGKGAPREKSPALADESGDGGHDRGAGAPEPRESECPLTALGHNDGVFYFFDVKGQFRALNPTQLATRGHLDALLGGALGWASAAHPAFNKEGEPIPGEYSVKGLGRDLIRRCFKAGLFRLDEPRRGVGVWRDADGVPVLHLGDAVIFLRGKEREKRDAGFRAGGALWPAAPAIRPPARPALAEEAQRMQGLFARWNWGGQPQERVFFGLWSAQLLGAAIRWRPHGLVVGPPGSGKTTLMELYAAASPLAMLLNDYTEAGIRQSLTGRAGPLLLDEAEGDKEGAERLQRVIELLRRASGGAGAQVVRGSSGGQGQRFEVMSPAMLGAVLPPTLLPQDASRITRLDLRARQEGGQGLPGAEDLAWVRKATPMLWGRALAGLPRFEANFALVHAALMARGCAPRLADQVGTIVAARAMMLSDDPLAPAEANEEVGQVAWLAVTEADQAPDMGPQACLTHLLQSVVDMTRNGTKPTVGALVVAATEPDGKTEREVLADHGLLVAPWPRKSDGRPSLYVADSHPRLAKLFEGTQWAAGRWKEDLRRLPKVAVPDTPQWIGKAKPRCTVLPPDLLPEGEAAPPATLAQLEALQEEFGMADGWVLGMLKSKWPYAQAKDDAAGRRR